jgi:hypothetical protein
MRRQALYPPIAFSFIDASFDRGRFGWRQPFTGMAARQFPANPWMPLNLDDPGCGLAAAF